MLRCFKEHKHAATPYSNATPNNDPVSDCEKRDGGHTLKGHIMLINKHLFNNTFYTTENPRLSFIKIVEIRLGVKLFYYK